MSIDFKQILALVLVLVTMGFIAFAVGSSIGWILRKIFQWLFKQNWFAKKVLRIQVGLQHWWEKYLPDFTKLFEFLYEVFADPLFYGYALVVVVDRMQSIGEYTKQYPQYSFFQILEFDMNTDTTFYLIFLIVFTLWMFGKAWKHKQDSRNHKEITKSLESISEVLLKMNTRLDSMPHNIRRTRFRRRIK